MIDIKEIIRAVSQRLSAKEQVAGVLEELKSLYSKFADEADLDFENGKTMNGGRKPGAVREEGKNGGNKAEQKKAKL